MKKDEENDDGEKDENGDTNEDNICIFTQNMNDEKE